MRWAVRGLGALVSTCRMRRLAGSDLHRWFFTCTASDPQVPPLLRPARAAVDDQVGRCGPIRSIRYVRLFQTWYLNILLSFWWDYLNTICPTVQRPAHFHMHQNYAHNTSCIIFACYPISCSKQYLMLASSSRMHVITIFVPILFVVIALNLMSCARRSTNTNQILTNHVI
jgi:hypothetical protein